MDARTHWEQIYGSKRATEVSWYQSEPAVSLALIRKFVPDRGSAIIDIGGGASTLVDRLLDSDYRSVTVLDISAEALGQAQTRLAERAELVTWVEANVLEEPLPPAGFDFWHDRAVFHFLTQASDRRRYIEQVHRAVRVGGHVAVATFAPDGPTQCSGLEVLRYDPSELHAEFGADFRLLQSEREEHTTPTGAVQPFTYCMCRVRGVVPR